jgi:lipopolysaccharide/colanic/teichoic acid biosynthesis glycosyltransferase
MTPTFYSRIGKRWFDVACALAGLALLAIPFAIVAILVKLRSPGPVFFRQNRTGQFGRPFRIFKFRTMIVTSGKGPLLTVAGDSRITRIGKWLRSSKVDELPQLINVLLGDMSMVGPRPEVPAYTDTFTEEQRQIFTAKPGITGPSANVLEEELLASQPDTEAFYLSTVLPSKLKIDLAYCRDINFGGDLYLILRTISRVLTRIVELNKPMNPSPKNSATGSD